MKKIFCLLFICSAIILPQNKYYIFLKDKGESNNQSLNKSSAQYKSALESLSQRAVERRKKVMGEDFILYEDLPLYQPYLTELDKNKVHIANQLKWFNAVTAYLSAEQLSLISKLSFVKNVAPVKRYLIKPEKISSDQQLSKKNDLFYGLSYMQLTLSDIPEVHSLGINGSGVLIGILDTGFDWSRHNSLKYAHVLGERDFIQGDSITSNQGNDAPSQQDHGTAVFSIIGGFRDSVLIGAAYGASFLLAKTEKVFSETHAEEDNYAAALEWMESRGVDITTSSLGYNLFDTGIDYSYKDMNGYTTIVTKAAKMAFDRGVVTVTAAGNEGDNNWHYIIAPGDENNILTVGAVNSNRIVTSFSGRGPTYDGRIKPEICALGSGVYTATASTTDDYGSGSGTSFATPIASGVTALLLSAFPYLDNMQVRSIVINTAGNYKTPDNNIGYGIISAKRALELPNIERAANNIIIHKILFTPHVNSETVKCVYITAIDTTLIPMTFDGLKYSAQLPVQAMNAKGNFYFTYSDSAGNSLREPLQNNSMFTYYYGKSAVYPSDVVTAAPFDYGVLSQNYPNPFNNTTKISFNAKISDVTSLTIYNSLGEKVNSYTPSITFSGEQTFLWNGKNINGVQLPSGVYIYQLTLNGEVHSKKMILLK